MVKYITSRPLWFNILVGIALVVIVFLLFMFSLNWLTKHGSSKTVPSVVGKNINDVQKLLSDAGFETVIQDSVYYDSLPRGIVIKQVPDADQVVKVNRTVYVVINRFVPPDIAMPNLIGYSLRNAQYTLEGLGLKLGDTTSRIDFAKNSVLEMLFNGNTMKPGDKIRVGSSIDLVLARGLANEDVAVPKLIGLTLDEARMVLEERGLTLGTAIAFGVQDTAAAYIYRQVPVPKTEDGVTIRVRQGQMVDVWLQVEKPVIDSVPPPNDIPQTPQLPQ
jgi:beta-lactam-binding protein with PASTA domain